MEHLLHYRNPVTFIIQLILSKTRSLCINWSLLKEFLIYISTQKLELDAHLLTKLKQNIIECCQHNLIFGGWKTKEEKIWIYLWSIIVEKWFKMFQTFFPYLFSLRKLILYNFKILAVKNPILRNWYYSKDRIKKSNKIVNVLNFIGGNVIKKWLKKKRKRGKTV